MNYATQLVISIAGMLLGITINTKENMFVFTELMWRKFKPV